MDASRRRRRDFIQNIAIVLLSLSAVALFTQTQLYNLGRPEDGSYFGQTSASASGVQSPQGLTDLAAPVRVAVTSSHTYGRYGTLCLTTDNEAFFPLLSEALASASAFTPCEAGDFLAALNESSVYYDFLSPLPLSILAGLTGVTLEDRFVLPQPVAPENAGQLAQLLRQEDAPTAIFCTADRIAAQLMQLLSAQGFRVPEDISVLGFDNLPLAEITQPPLTTLAQDIEQKARLVVDMLLRHIRQDSLAPERTLLGVWLVERQSVRRIGLPVEAQPPQPAD